ncbi:sulfurtransferase TusA family protein [Amorphus sp. 3PC139-8]|uniref:sulfurtransferase TusA family protein n=1 Tax=Amorphus sp. 3PC139-8 TaxID=2735676 RepID=UPI00345C6B52
MRQTEAEAPSGETLLDLKGLNCPMPVLRLAKAIRGAAPGTRFRVLATDPLAALDIAHFCQTKGHTLISSEDDDGVGSYVVAAGTGSPEINSL